MSESFEERRKSHESKWAHDEELRFKVTARRNKLLGQWAGKELGLKGPDMEAYAKEVVQVDLSEPGHHDVFRKIRADFDAKNVSVSDHMIRKKMEDLLSVAGEQVMSETKK
jgi:hypothetical protein